MTWRHNKMAITLSASEVIKPLPCTWNSNFLVPNYSDGEVVEALLTWLVDRRQLVMETSCVDLWHFRLTTGKLVCPCHIYEVINIYYLIKVGLETNIIFSVHIRSHTPELWAQNIRDFCSWSTTWWSGVFSQTPTHYSLNNTVKSFFLNDRLNLIFFRLLRI